MTDPLLAATDMVLAATDSLLPAADTVLALLVLQFLLAAVMWMGSAPLRRFRLPRGPGWARVELTRLVLPLLMVVAGLLFFSTPLAPLWGPTLGLEAFGGVPAALGRWAFAGLNIGVVTILVVATGGVGRSPFTPLAVAVPLMAWAVGVPLLEAVGAGILVAAAFAATSLVPATPLAPVTPTTASTPPATTPIQEQGPGWNRGAVLVFTALVVVAALWMGGRLGG
ncbi:MAG: hypothetical protein EA421_10840 [Gemmatimonadales bacterium]|nr:MAG: hypothetical protein EA421_10840 [Gemmatimonadales bacterium]